MLRYVLPVFVADVIFAHNGQNRRHKKGDTQSDSPKGSTGPGRSLIFTIPFSQHENNQAVDLALTRALPFIYREPIWAQMVDSWLLNSWHVTWI